MKKLLLISALIAAAILVGFNAVTGVSAQTTQTIQVSEKEFSLTPSAFTVQMGQPVQVTVTNNGTVQHNLSFRSPSGNTSKQLFTTNLNPGETRTAQFTFTEAGDWTMFCPIPGHEQAGMKGVIHVLSAAAGAAATKTPTANMTPMASVTPTASGPSNLPTTGGDVPISSLLMAGLFGVLLVAAGIAMRSWTTK